MAVHLSAPQLLAASPRSDGPSATKSGEHLGEEAELARATGLYDSGQYEACADAFERLLGAEETRRLHAPANVETARTYQGACLIGVGRTTDAERIFREAIRENPQMKAPDGLLFPETVVESFLRVRESMMDEIRRAEQKRLQDADTKATRDESLRQRERLRVEQLVELAETEIVIERHSRWIASIPFGVGQFQNGDSGLGWLFLVSETAMSGLLFGSLYMQAWYQSQSGDPQASPAAIDTGTHTALTLQQISGYGLLGLGLLGITQAHLGFVPEVRIERKRSLPAELKRPSTKVSVQSPSVTLQLLPWTAPGSLGGSVVGVF